MTAPRLLFVAAVALCACSKAKDDKAKAPAGSLDAKCEALATVCGDTDKHIAKILDECKQTNAKLGAPCTDKASAAYDCYTKELCGGKDKVWALDDLRVLVDRHGKCVAERDAVKACTPK
jgi:hypothetical protein